MRALTQDEETHEVPLTPLVDVVFQLLIFFLVATNFVRKEIDQKIQLPKAEAGEKQEHIPENLVINVRENGAVVINGRVVEPERLRSLVAAWHEKNKGKTVCIRGDGRVPYERIMKIMGICKAVGVNRVDLPVEEARTEAAGW